ncbi:MAG: twin-arginine translocase subunit TatC [Blastocatellia bacterium AA13]|nr:MAG: twin-arginine translocase subunit TatC [Blastocatellia bacterium AA13]
MMTAAAGHKDEKDPEKDDRSSMSFLEHLDELRKRLIRCALYIFIAFLVCWYFSSRIYHFLEIPVRRAMVEAKRTAGVEVGVSAADRFSVQDLPDNSEMNFTFPTDCNLKLLDADGKEVDSALVTANTTIRVKVKHAADGLAQLVTDTYWLVNSDKVIQPGTVIPPTLYSSIAQQMSPDNRLVVPTVQGAFNLYIKVSFYAAIFFTMPFLLVQAWGFIAPGLYPHEKKYAAPFIMMASVFFLMGCAFAYYIAFPRAANFLLGVATEGNLRPLVTADDYFELIMTIMLGLGLVFEMPTLTFFFARLGLVTPKLLLKVWRYAIVIIFIIAAVLSPTTDIPNMLVFAAPMILLYFLSVGIAWVFHRKRRTEAEAQAENS